jgi:hypothetical protein
MTWEHDARHAHFDGRVFDRLQGVMDWWAKRGFATVNLPWMVPERFVLATRQPEARLPDPATSEGFLVGSAEQAFLWLDEQGLLPKESPGLIGWTACFRHEAYDRWRHHYFMKAELFVPVARNHAYRRMGAMVSMVQACWQARAKAEGLGERTLKVKVTGPESVDLMLGPVELGSYGVRERLGGRGAYLYGTALAEPRWFKSWSSVSV